MFSRFYMPYYECVKHRIIWLEKHSSGGVVCRYDPKPDFPIASAMAGAAMEAGTPATTEIIVTGSLLAEGPKIFDFSARDCEALENFDLSLPGKEYAQPFPTIMIRLPKDYCTNRIVSFTQDGLNLKHAPQDIIVHHDTTIDRVMVNMRMSSTQCLTRNIRILPEESIEDGWKESCRMFQGKEKFLDVSKEEEVLSDSLTRLALAANLFLMVYGTKKMGPENVKHAEKLQKYLKNAEKTGDKQRIKEAHFDLKVVPVIYSFAQKVKLYTSESKYQETGSGGGHPLKPHWRRGYFKMQHHGPGNTLRKRIAIHAVLVNAHLFRGGEEATEVTYHT